MNTKKVDAMIVKIIVVLVLALTTQHVAARESAEWCSDPNHVFPEQPAPVTGSEFCKGILTGDVDIPVGDFTTSLTIPLQPEYITQGYNNDAGHNGVDFAGDCTGTLANDGKEEIHSTMNGVSLLSYEDGYTSDWGEAVCTVTRTNAYSEAILSFCYHHFKKEKRFVGACTPVDAGTWLGMEGTTGHSTGPHLHYTVRFWKSLKELKKALDPLTKEGKWNTQKKNALSSFFGGHGYGAQNGAHLKGMLNPYTLLHNTFLEYEGESTDPFFPGSYAYVRHMRMQGIEFGDFKGNYGSAELAKRRDIARWLKIGGDFPTPDPASPTYADVSEDDPDFPYIEAMVRNPAGTPVLNPDANVIGGNHYMYPDQLATRAQVIKMAVLTFYPDEYQKFYQNFFWAQNALYAPMWLAALLGVDESTLFQDVNLNDWYASYVYFGVTKGFVAFGTNQYFRPADPITWAEVAKWVILGRSDMKFTVTSCSNIWCPAGTYCDDASASCMESPECIPSETQECEVGGGYDPCSDGVCTPGQTQTQVCGGAGQQERSCNSECQWDAWGTCQYSGCQQGQTLACGNCGTSTCNSGVWGACLNQGLCTPGQVEMASCSGGGTQQRTCTGACSWSAWSDCPVQQVCTPGQTQSCGNCGTMTCDGNGQWGACLNEGVCFPGQTQSQSCNGSGTQTKTCNSSCQWGSWGSCNGGCECSSGVCCDGCNYRDSGYTCDTTYVYQCQGSDPGDDAQKAMVRTYCSGNDTDCNGSQTQFGWQTYEDCSTNQVCEMSGGVSGCVAYQSCTDTYTPNMSQSCFTNSQSAGSPTLCLKVTKVSGSQFKYSLCKQGSAFQNDFKYHLVDDNNMVQFTEYTGSPGVTCTSEKTFNVSYIPGYGQVNGAALRVLVTSPSGCSQSSCQYQTGGITITEACL